MPGRTGLLALAALAVLAACGGGTPAPAGSWTERPVFFTSGATRLYGVLAEPARGGRHPAVVLLTGSGRGGVATPLLRTHARTLAGDGFAVLRFDPPGVGRSGGGNGVETLQDRTQQALAAVRYLRTRSDIARDEVGLWGESQGGWVTQMAAAAAPAAVAFVASVSGSGVSVAEQQVYSVEAQSRAAGFPARDVAKATLVARLLVDGQLTRDRYRAVNDAEALRLGPGPWRDLAALVYAAPPVATREALARTIAILKQIRLEPWALFLYLDTTTLPALEAIPPSQAEAARAAAEQSLLVDPKDFLTRVRCPVLALFGADDTIVPARRSAALYRRYLRQAGADDVTIVVVPNAGHSLDGFGASYWTTLTDWLRSRTSS